MDTKSKDKTIVKMLAFFLWSMFGDTGLLFKEVYEETLEIEQMSNETYRVCVIYLHGLYKFSNFYI